jgi:hypothetical protein
VNRNGSSNLGVVKTTGGSITAGSMMGVRGDELVMTDGKIVYGWAGDVRAKWVPRGRHATVNIDANHIVGASQVSAQDTDCATNANGVALYTFGAGLGSVYSYLLVDTTTGVIIHNGSNGLAGNPGLVRVVCVGDTFMLFGSDAGGTNLLVYTVSASTPGALSASTTLVTDMVGGRFDVKVDATAGTALVAYHRNTPSTRCLVVSTAPAITASSTFAFTPDQAIGWMTGADPTGLISYVGVASTVPGQGVRRLAVTMSTGVITGSTNVDTAVITARNLTGIVDAAGSVHVFYDVPGVATLDNRIEGGPAGSFVFMRSASIASRMFLVGTRAFVVVAFVSASPQRATILLEYDSSLTSSDGAVSIAGLVLASNGVGVCARPGSVGLLDATVHEYIWCGTASQNLTDSQYDLVACGLAFNETGIGSPVEFADVLNFPGGVLKTYDGTAVTEGGFVIGAEPAACTAVNGAGTLTVGEYGVIVVYKSIDHSGRIIRSAASPETLVTLAGASDTIDLVIPTCRITERATRYNLSVNVNTVVIEVYRTEVDAANYYLDSTIANSVTADTVALSLTKSDATLIATGEVLYSNDGAAVDNFMPAAPRVLCTFQSRMFALTGSSEIWHTQRIAEGIAAEFSDSLRIIFDHANGALTGLGDLDDKLIAFTRRAAFVILGDGPEDNGAPQYPQPQRTAVIEGVVDPRSVAKTPDGLLYKGPSGMLMLSRGLESVSLSAIASCKDMVVTGAAVCDGIEHVRFTTAYPSNTCLVYDYRHKCWFTWSTKTTGPYIDAVATCVWRNVWVRLSTLGVVSYEDSNVLTDNLLPINSVLTMTWISWGKPLGDVRVWALQLLGTFAVGAQVFIDYASSYDADNTIESKSITPAAAAAVVELRPVIQIARSAFVSINGTSGFQVSQVAFELGVEEPAMLPSATALRMT